MINLELLRLTKEQALTRQEEEELLEVIRLVPAIPLLVSLVQQALAEVDLVALKLVVLAASTLMTSSVLLEALVEAGEEQVRFKRR